MLRMEMFGAHNVFQLIFNEAHRLFHSIDCLCLMRVRVSPSSDYFGLFAFLFIAWKK